MERGLAEEEVEQGGIVGLNDKKEDLFGWYSEESRTNDRIGWICPYLGVNEVRIPRSGGDDSDLERVSAY